MWLTILLQAGILVVIVTAKYNESISRELRVVKEGVSERIMIRRPGQVAYSRTAHCSVSGSSPTGVLVRPTQPSTLKREENEYVPSGAEYEIHCLHNCEVPCYGHARWHSGALLASSRPGSAWLSD